MLPVEFVVRGYLSGSAGSTTGSPARSAGTRFRQGLRESDRLPEPIVTPATKADEGHDLNITEAEAPRSAAPSATTRRARPRSRSTRSRAAHAEARGIVLADTKFEFGVDADGVVTLGDEALTPDSSRFWPGDATRRAGRSRRSTSSTCATSASRPAGTAPTRARAPGDVVAGTRARYVEAFERLTEIPFDRYLSDPRWCCEGDRADPSQGRHSRPAGRGGRRRRSRRSGFAVVRRSRRPARRRRARRADDPEARARVDRMCAELLANPLIESFTIAIGGRVRDAGRGSRSSRSPARTTTATRCSRSRCSARARSRVWHADDAAARRGIGGVVLPGGFSYGDYLRCGAIARFAPGDGRGRRVRRGRRAGARDLQRLPDPLRGRAAAGRAPPQPAAGVRLRRRHGDGRDDRDARSRSAAATASGS